MLLRAFNQLTVKQKLNAGIESAAKTSNLRLPAQHSKPSQGAC